MNQGNASSTRQPIARDEIAIRVVAILAEEADMEPGDVRESHSLTEDLMFDSLQVVEAVMELEEEFDVNIPDDAAEGMRTVGDVINGMCKLLEA